MVKVIFGVLLVALSLPCQGADRLEELVRQRLSEIPFDSFQVSESLAIIGYFPVESFEYRYGYDDLDEHSEDHSLRFKFKSLKEIFSTGESLKATRQLVALEKTASTNLKIYRVYLGILQEAFAHRLRILFQTRQQELKGQMDKSSLSMGLAKADSKDLIRGLNLLEEIEEKLGMAQARFETDLPPEISEEILSNLIKRVDALQMNLKSLSGEPYGLEIAIQKAENDLERLNRELSWAEDEKILSFFEVQRDPIDKETSYRIAVNIPIWFDRVEKAREKALLYSKDRAFERQQLEKQAELNEQLGELQALAVQVQSLASRQAKTDEIRKRLRKVRDPELRLMMDELRFELSEELVLKSYEYLVGYLEYLKELGIFARHPEVNFFRPDWRTRLGGA